MSALSVDITKAVETLLNGGTYSHSIDLRRLYNINEEPDSLPDRSTGNPYPVFLRPHRNTGTPNHRDNLVQAAVQVDVALMAAIHDPNDVTEVDELIFLVEEIQDRITQNPVLSGIRATFAPPWVNDPIFDVGLLKEANVFLSVTQTQWRVERGSHE